jgi:hypothetical protein
MKRGYSITVDIVKKMLAKHKIGLVDLMVRRDDNILEWNPKYKAEMNAIMTTYFNSREDDGI